MKPVLALWFWALASVLAAQGTDPFSVVPSPAPGVYPAPLVLGMEARGGVEYRFLEGPGAATQGWPGTLTLDALPGESRVYTLRLTASTPSGESTTRDFRYVVERPAVGLPTVHPVPGTYTRGLTVVPQLPPGWVAEGKSWDLDVPLGAVRTFVLGARSASRSVSWAYTIDRRDQESSSLEVLSPAPGAWSNAQVLLLAFRGVDRVLWSYGPNLNHPQTYEGPVVLDRSGPQSVTVSARSRLGGWITKTVQWTNGTQPSPPGWPASGAWVETLRFPRVSDWEVSWDQGKSWVPSAETREALPETGGKILVVQGRHPEGVARWVYSLEKRVPEVPQLEYTGGWNPQLVFSGSFEALHTVEWLGANGSTETEALWGPRGAWKVPDGVVGARVQARGTNGLVSQAASIAFEATGWAVPGWEPWGESGVMAAGPTPPLGGRVPGRTGFQAVYEVASTPEVPEPNAESSVLEGALLPTVPPGADRTFYARFAWRDASGLVGPASPVVTLRVDRVAPRSPEVTLASGRVVVLPGEEDGELFWAVTPQRVVGDEPLDFQAYREPIDPRGLGTKGLWLHARARDASGNWSVPRLNVALPGTTLNPTSVVHVDPDPRVGDVAVENGGVYPWPELRLRSNDAGSPLWVGLTEAPEVPQDWATQVRPWNGLLTQGVGFGERKTFWVYWNEKTERGWAWAEPKRIRLVVDRGPPVAPGPVRWPSPRAEAWTLTLNPPRPGDVLLYTASVDGQVPGDPVRVGQSWPGSVTWDAPEGKMVEVRLRVASVSVSGQSVELPSVPVVIDRRYPPAVEPGLGPFTWRDAPVTIPAPAGTPEVRYTLTTDGSPPPVPDHDSPLVGQSQVLEGRPGQAVLYRLRWRAFSATGIPGQPSEPTSVLIDRTAPTAPSMVRSTTEAEAVPPIRGLPASGIASTPVVLSADPLGGRLRYELVEGEGEPRPVGPASPAWTGSLSLGTPGVDRSYVLALRVWDEGPGSAEVQLRVRVDLAAPQAPSLALRKDARRPEVVLVPRGVSPEEKLSYRWTWESFPQGRGESEWIEYSSPAVFSAPGGDLTRLRVQAYSRDEAGNQGPTTEVSVLIDQSVVYVSPGAQGDGSREAPLGSLAAAVEKARLEGKARVFMAAGRFVVDQTLEVGGLRFFGGLDAIQWEAGKPTRTTWAASSTFSGISFLEAGDRAWSLDRVDLDVEAARPKHLAEVRGASVSVQNSDWSGGAGWWQTGGTLELISVAATFSASAPFLDVRGVGLSVVGLTLNATENQGQVLVQLNEGRTLVRNLTVVSRRGRGYEAVLSASGGTLVVEGARILAGDGVDRALGFVLKDCESQLWNTEVNLFGTQTNTAFQVVGGSLELQKTTVGLLRGEEFNQVLVVERAKVSVTAYQWKVDRGTYQGGITVDSGSLTLQTGTLGLSGGGKKAWGAQFLGPCLVKMSDASWVLDTKTPGDPWVTNQPWLAGSSVTRSTTKGW